jgi:hypothetical protein
MSVKTYDPALYTIVLAGVPIKKGYADGEFIKVARDTDAFTDVAGADGEVARAKQRDKRATCTLTLLQTAEANALLSTLALLDETADNGGGVGPFLLKDRGGLSVNSAESCWVKRMPDVTLDKGVTARVWEIRIASLDAFEGGN